MKTVWIDNLNFAYAPCSFVVVIERNFLGNCWSFLARNSFKSLWAFLV